MRKILLYILIGIAIAAGTFVVFKTRSEQARYRGYKQSSLNAIGEIIDKLNVLKDCYKGQEKISLVAASLADFGDEKTDIQNDINNIIQTKTIGKKEVASAQEENIALQTNLVWIKNEYDQCVKSKSAI